MAVLNSSSYNISAPGSGNVEPLLLRLPLELRRNIYSFIFGPPRLVDLTYIQVELEPLITSRIYRSTPEKLQEFNDQKDDDDTTSEFERRLMREWDEGPNNRDDPRYEWGEYFGAEVMWEWRTAILGVSKAISNEALDVLYGRNTFVVNVHANGYRKFLKFGAANLRRIRHLRIVAASDVTYCLEPLIFDPQLWLPLLKDLQHFCLVAQQPTVAQGFYKINTSNLEEDVGVWMDWLDPILRYFGENLPKTTVISLDDDDHAQTTATMEKHFIHGFQKFKTGTGDFYFKRGQFAMETGYWDTDEFNEADEWTDDESSD